MKFYILSILSILLSVGLSTADEITTTISGQVINEETGEGLPGVHVIVDELKKGAVTDGNGNFIIRSIPLGNHTITVKMIGYATYTEEVELQEVGLELELKLKEEIYVLKGAQVQANSITGGMTKVSDLTGSAHYISPKELDKFSYNDIHRVLRNIPGVNIQDEEGFGLRPNIGFRGTGVERSSKITLMEDGILMAPAPYVAPAAYYFPTTGRMQGIEVRKGSSQIKYGPYTTGGALNLMSTSIPNELFGRVNLFGGSFGQRGVHAFVGDATERFGFLGETYQSASDGFKELDNGDNTGFKTEDYLVKFRYNTSEKAKVYQSLTFKAGKYIETSNETYLGLTDEDFKENPFRRYSASQEDLMKTDQSQLILTHYIQPSDNIRVSTSIYRTDFARNWYKLDKVKTVDSLGYTGIADILEDPLTYSAEYLILTGETSQLDDALSVKANNRSYYAQGIQSVAQWDFHGGKTDHLLDFGFRYHQDQIDRFQWVDKYRMEDGVMKLTEAGTPGTESNRIEDASALALYTQYTFKTNRLKLIPGLRYENILISRKDFGKNDPERTGVNLSTRSNRVDVWIPGIGMEYVINPRLKLISGVHKGFSPPGSKEGTNPEESVNYELGFRHENKTLRTGIIAFVNDYKNLLGVDLAAGGGTGSGDLFNGGTAMVQGIEVDFYFGPRISESLILPIQLSYTFTNAYFTNSFESEFDAWGSVQEGDKLPYIAPHQLVLNAGLEHSRFNFNLSSKYTDTMRTVAGQGSIPFNESTDSSFILDASFQYNFSWKISAFTSVYNLTNVEYIVSRRPAGVRPGLPRSFTLGVKANF